MKMSFCSFTGGEKYKNHFSPGIYACAYCGHPLFSSTAKYKHSSPWPAFNKTIQENSVSKKHESATALRVRCGKCNNALGHEFLHEGPNGESRF